MRVLLMQQFLLFALVLVLCPQLALSGSYYWVHVRHGHKYDAWQSNSCWNLYPHLRHRSLSSDGTSSHSWFRHSYNCKYISCNHGHGPASSMCPQCEKDYYNTNVEAACTRCPHGKYTDFKGASTSSQCKNCAEPCSRCTSGNKKCVQGHCMSEYRWAGDNECVCNKENYGVAPSCKNQLCVTGYFANDKGKVCNVDVDECSETRDAYKHDCDLEKSVCVNEVGYFGCRCILGWHFGNGRKLGGRPHEEVCVPEPLSVDLTASSNSIMADLTFNDGIYGQYELTLQKYSDNMATLQEITAYTNVRTEGNRYIFENLPSGSKYQLTVTAVVCTVYSGQTMNDRDCGTLNPDPEATIVEDIWTTCGCSHEVPTGQLDTWQLKAATSQPSTNTNLKPHKMVDGDPVSQGASNTFWWRVSANAKQNPWVIIDLGLVYTIGRIEFVSGWASSRVWTFTSRESISETTPWNPCGSKAIQANDLHFLTCSSVHSGRFIKALNNAQEQMKIREIKVQPHTCDYYEMHQSTKMYYSIQKPANMDCVDISQVQALLDECQDMGNTDLSATRGCVGVYCNANTCCPDSRSMHIPGISTQTYYECKSRPDSGDDTGMPVSFVATQTQGFMQFAWQDASKCEDSFSLFRRAMVGGTDKISFTEDYSYTSNEQCGVDHAPAFVRQDLAVMEDDLGKTVEFCIEAVTLIDGGKTFSNAHCVATLIKYEASMQGHVLLSRTAGSLPVKNVKISYDFEEDNYHGFVTTDNEGKYAISIKTEMVSRLDPIMTLHIEKYSGSVAHVFKCDDYNTCASKSIKLRHLSFGTVQNFEDTTSVAFSGTVYIKGTESVEQPNGCPLVNTKVCLVGYEDDAEYACSYSDDLGMYQLPATIGTQVKTKVRYVGYEGHTFERVQSNVEEGEVEKFIVNVDSVFQNIDFRDNSTRELKVEVCMGQCNLFMGPSEVNLKHATCVAFGRSLRLEDAAYGYFTVPATQLLVGFTSVEDNKGDQTGNTLDDVYNFFTNVYGEGAYQEIDLRIMPGTSTDEQEGQADAEAKMADVNAETGTDSDASGDGGVVESRVRFEFHPRATPTVVFTGDQSGDVVDYGCVNPVDQDPGVAIQKDRTVNVTVSIQEHYQLQESTLTCGLVNGSVWITNLLGMSPEWKEEQLNDEERTITDEELEMLTKCNDISDPCKRELSMFKPTHVADNVVATMSDSHNAATDPPSNCVDKDGSTVCLSPKSDNPWLMLNLGSMQHIESVKLTGCMEGVESSSSGSCITSSFGKFEIWLLESGEANFVNNGKICHVSAEDATGNEQDEQSQGTGEGEGETKALEEDAKCLGYSQYVLIRMVGVNRTLEFSEVEVNVREPWEHGSQTGMRLKIGDPNILAGEVDADHPYSKLFQVLVPFVGYTVVEARRKIVVAGDHILDKLGSVGLPRYYPLTVLHDPPGGLSFSTYENVEVSMNVKVTDSEQDLTHHYHPTFGAGLDVTVERCGTANCNGIVSVQAGVAATLPYGDKTYEHDTETSSHKLTIKFSYTTSHNQAVPGEESDMFLIPSMNIIFMNVRTIFFNQTTCTGDAVDSIRWGLDKHGDAENMIAYVSKWDILHREIPVLEAMRQQEQDFLTNCDILQAEGDWPLETQEACNESQGKFDHTDKGVQHWEAVLSRNNQTLNQAKNGALTTVNGLLTGHKRDVAPDLGLAPEKLLNQMESLTAGEAAEVSQWKNTSSLKFTGGGGLTEYHISEEHWKDTQLGMRATAHFEGQGDIGLDLTILVVELKLGFDFQVTYDLTSSQTLNFRKDINSKVGFSLGDSDFGDAWVVDVAIDPNYGTFVFNTVGGFSSCPHEAGTTAREAFEIELVDYPLVPPREDERARFTFNVKNLGQTTDIVLYTYDWMNPDGLEIMINGDPTFAEILLEDFPTGQAEIVVYVKRGPIKYDTYDPISMFVGSFCERERFLEGHDGKYVWTDLQEKRSTWVIDSTIFTPAFERPCPVVKIAGALRESMSFSVNSRSLLEDPLHGDEIRLTVQNPLIDTDGPWQDSMDNHNLQTVQGEYRVAGDNIWRPCKDKAGNILDFIATESPVGFAVGYWHVGPLPDGEYEVRVKSRCLSTTTEPIKGIDYQMTESIHGVVDRDAPWQFGMTQPADGSFFPGDLIGVSFNEDIDCSFPYYFDLTLIVYEDAGKETVYNNRNMVIQCEKRQLHVGFKNDVAYSEVMGKKALLRVHNVMDVNKNLMRYDVEHKFSFSEISVNDAAVYVYGMKLFLPWLVDYNDFNSPKSQVLKDGLISDLAWLLNCEPRRIHIVSLHKGDDEGKRVTDPDFPDGTVMVDWIMEGTVDEDSFSSIFLINFLSSIMTNANLEHYLVEGTYVSALHRTTLSTIVIPSAADQAHHLSVRANADLVDETLCAQIQWDGITADEGTFSYNADDALVDNHVKFYISNPVPGRSWTSYGDRVTSIQLEYRMAGSLEWKVMEGTYENTETGETVTMKSLVELGDGDVYHVDWDVSKLPDMRYQVRAHTICAPNTTAAPGPLVNEGFSTVLSGVIDRVEPVFEAPTNDYYPGMPLVFSFYEDINCDQSNMEAVLVMEDQTEIRGRFVNFVCEKNKLTVDFHIVGAIDYNDLIMDHHPAHLSVIGVKDLNGNVMSHGLEHDFYFGHVDLTEAAVSVHGFPVIDGTFPESEAELAAFKLIVAGALADQWEVDPSRFTVIDAVNADAVYCNFIIEAGTPDAAFMAHQLHVSMQHIPMEMTLIPSSADKHGIMVTMANKKAHSTLSASHMMHTQSLLSAAPAADVAPVADNTSVLHMYQYQIRMCVTMVFVVSVVYHIAATVRNMMSKK